MATTASVVTVMPRVGGNGFPANVNVITKPHISTDMRLPVGVPRDSIHDSWKCWGDRTPTSSYGCSDKAQTDVGLCAKCYLEIVGEAGAESQRAKEMKAVPAPTPPIPAWFGQIPWVSLPVG